MKKSIYLKSCKLFILLIGIVLGLGSCKSSSSLTDSGLVQKRRYQNGYHLNLKSHSSDKSNKDRLAQKEELAQNEKETPLVASIDGQLSLEQQLPPKELKTLPEQKSNFEVKVPANEKNVKPPKVRSEGPQSVKKHSEYSPCSPQPDYYGHTIKKLNTLALLSFIFALLSLIILGIPFGIAAVVCGIIGLNQISKSPDVYKGKGFAIVGIIIGLIAVVVVLAALSTM